MTQVKLKDASGRTHVICEGDAHTGEIRYAPTGHDMCRLRLFKNQAVKIQKKEMRVSLYWNGKCFVAVCDAA